MHSSQKSDTSLEKTSNDTSPRPIYRPPKPIPYELREHCVIYFEEELYVQALTLLLNLLLAGTSSLTPVPAFVPPPQHLALAATLTVHPSLTTRAKSADRLQASILALRLLRHTLKLVGPLNANFDAAFAFSYFNTSRRGGDGRSSGGRRRKGGEEDVVGGGGEDPEAINSEIANAGSVWGRAEDFWQVVGWGLNCSVGWPGRWVRWRGWLEFMVDVLEEDWGVRVGTEVEEGESAEEVMRRSLIAKYLRLEGGGLGGNRSVVRAIFADGGTKAMNEFTEVFRNETKERKKSDGVVKRPEKKVNVEEDEFADYLDDDDDEDDDDEDDDDADDVVNGKPTPESAPTPSKDSPPNQDHTSTDGSALLGGMASITLRLRLLALLSTVSDTLPTHFLPVSALYDLYNDQIRPLPIATFQLLTSPSNPAFSPVARSALNQFILRSLIASSAPNPPTDDLDQDLLERYFLPYAANTASVADNAKVSLLLESLLRLVVRYIGVRVTEGLESAVRVGIEAREKKSVQDRRKKGAAKKGEEEDRAWLVGSGERLRGLLEVCKE